MNQFKKLVILELMILIIQFKKLKITKKLMKLKTKTTDYDHAKYIATQ